MKRPKDILVTVFRNEELVYENTFFTSSTATRVIREFFSLSKMGEKFLGKIQSKKDGSVVVTMDGVNFEGHPRVNF